METEDNVVEFTGEWQGTDDGVEMTQDEYEAAMAELMREVTDEDLAKMISGVLEILTARALIDGAYYILTDDENAMAVFATDKDAETLKSLLPKTFKSWEDDIGVVEYHTNTDPGDEQDEPAAESE